MFDSIMEDVRWLGFDWGDRLYYASDYFERLYEFAEALIKKGKAFVCDLTFDQMREYRGTLNTPARRVLTVIGRSKKTSIFFAA